MKTTIVVMAALLWSTSSYASGKVQLSMKPAGDESALVEILKSSETEVEVDVTNEFNEVIFYKKLSDPTANYQRKYDFSGLDDGKYRMTVESGDETNETWFKIERGEVIVENNRKVVEPHIKTEGNMWKMTLLNYPMENLDLYVYDGYNLLLHKEIKPEFAVHAGLDFSELFPGEYNIILSNEHNTFEYVMKVN